MKHDTAGDPMNGLKWTRRTTAKVAAELNGMGMVVSDRTVARLLKKLGFSLRVNPKKLSSGSHPDRDAQFVRIAELRERCASGQLPIISIDTKKKELIGCFKNPGITWDRVPVLVKDHDFRSEADGIAVPYGVYDLHANQGTLFIGTSYDTPGFAVDCVEKWWRTEGRQRYPDANGLTILADAGGSNAPESNAGYQCQKASRSSRRTATQESKRPPHTLDRCLHRSVRSRRMALWLWPVHLGSTCEWQRCRTCLVWSLVWPPLNEVA